MAGKEIAVKKYVVRLDAEERNRLDALIRKGKRSAQLLTKARILLKADISDAGEGWSDSRIAKALDTSIANVERTRRQLVEEGLGAVLTRKYNPNSARPRIFDGVAEAKLIALTCSPAPAGFARWSLRLLEEKVVELHIVERASDNTIGRTLKKRSQTASQAAMGDSARRQRGVCRHHGRRAGSLSATARSAAPARVPRRNLQAVDHRDARADPPKRGTTSASRLRIRTQWRRQSLHGVSAAGRLERNTQGTEDRYDPIENCLWDYSEGRMAFFDLFSCTLVPRESTCTAAPYRGTISGKRTVGTSGASSSAKQQEQVQVQTLEAGSSEWCLTSLDP